MEELPSPPEEKLLRAPTFGEKYGKYHWIIIVLLLVVIGIEGIYIAVNNTQAPQQRQTTRTASPTPAIDTTNWKTYTDAELGFSFKYPPEWSFNIYEPEDKTDEAIRMISLKHSHCDEEYDCDAASFDIMIIDKSKNLAGLALKKQDNPAYQQEL